METMLTVRDIAKQTRLAPSSVYALAKNKAIPHYRIGSRLVFSPKEIDSWLHSQHQPVGTQTKC